MAASGFHVSLVLGVILGLLNHPRLANHLVRPGLVKLGVGSAALTTYALITGAQPSIMRATVMGLGVLVGIVLERQVKPLGCLLLATTILLVWNPSWIEDIGFQLSVMATLGLVVATPALSDRLTWLPPGLASLVAVPLAAYSWTIPLSLFHFNTLTTYSLLLNMVVTPLVTVISLGGIFSGLVALLSPGIAAMVAWLLWLPTHLLIGLVEWETHLPGSSLATGQLTLWQLFSLYSLYSLYSLTAGGGWRRWQRWTLLWLIPLVGLGPLWYGAATRAQVTVLAAQADAVMVVQDRQSTLVVNSGTHRTAFYTLLPFLRQAGINRVDYGIRGVTSDSDNWRLIAAQAPVNRLYQAGTDAPLLQPTYPLALDQGHPLGRQRVQLLTDTGSALKLTLFDHDWLMLSGLAPLEQRQLVSQGAILASEVLWWDGAPLVPELLKAVHPRVAIASASRISSSLEQTLRAEGIQVFCPEQDGAITWTSRHGYQAYLATGRPNVSNLDS
ncbi:MAG: ComEC/Rec2 family competence protein [Nodosilinea sp. LVE1205-7]